MKFNPPLLSGRLLKRYRRFLADIETETGEKITIHCPNTGSMKNCLTEKGRIWYLPSNDPKRKTAGTWILAETPHQRIACVNTHYANNLVEEALENGVIASLQGYTKLRREVKYGEENSRIDFCLDYADGSTLYLEIKSVTLGFEDSMTAAFPDAVTERGSKHLRELTRLAESGIRTALLYCVNLSGITAVRAAKEIDPNYAIALKEAKSKGVEVFAYGTTLSPEEIKITQRLQIDD